MATVETEERREIEASRPGESEAPPERKRKRSPVLFLVLGVLLILAVLYGFRYFSYASSHATTDDAYVTSDIVQLAPQVSGTVLKVLVSDNDHVKEGQLIAALDDATYRAAVSQAQANLDLMLAQSQGAKTSTALTSQTGNAQIQQAQGVVEQSAGGAEAAVADVTRAQAAQSSAQANVKGAQAGVAGARSAISSAIAARERSRAAVSSAEAAVRNAQASVATAQANLVSAQATADRANKDVARIETLLSQGAVSAQQADAARAAAGVANAQVNAAREGVSAAQAGVQRAQSDVEAARAQLAASESAIGQANSQLVAAQSQVAASQQAVVQSAAQVNAARKNVVAAQGKTGQARGQLEQARTSTTQVQVSRNAEQQASARVEQAQAALEQAKINLERTKIYSPVSGTVSKKNVSVGTLVQPGTPLLAIVPDQVFWVTGNYKETDMAHVRIGEAAEIEVDALPQYKFVGRVQSIQPGTGATFALLPPENATGNFTKVVQRIPVKITLDPNQPGLDQLRVGMSCTAAISTKG